MNNSNEACIGIKPEIDIEAIKRSYWRLKRGIMVSGGLLFLCEAAHTIVDLQI